MRDLYTLSAREERRSEAIHRSRYETSDVVHGNNWHTSDAQPYTEIVIAGPASLFDVLFGLQLGVPIWRVADPAQRQLSGSALLLLDVRDLDRPEERVARSSAAARRYPTIVVCRGIDRREALAHAHAGAFGALDMATGDRTVLRRAILGALRGEPAFSREVLGRLLRERRHAPASRGGSSLTSRQLQVMALVARGASDRQIALALEISLATTQKHVANVLKRLGATNRAAAVSLALQASLIPAEAPAL